MSWKVRVVAALVLASLLRMSDGSELWRSVLPSMLTVGAIAVVALMVVAAKRGRRPPA